MMMMIEWWWHVHIWDDDLIIIVDVNKRFYQQKKKWKWKFQKSNHHWIMVINVIFFKFHHQKMSDLIHWWFIWRKKNWPNQFVFFYSGKLNFFSLVKSVHHHRSNFFLSLSLIRIVHNYGDNEKKKRSEIHSYFFPWKIKKK